MCMLNDCSEGLYSSLKKNPLFKLEALYIYYIYIIFGILELLGLALKYYVQPTGGLIQVMTGGGLS